MPRYNRTTLKNFFKNGTNPTEVHFSDLIDSSINKIDDGFAKSIDEGLQLSPLGNSNRVMSFYENITDKEPDWQFVINPKEEVKGLSVTEGDDRHRLFLEKNGNIGVGTLSPKSQLDVKGTSRSQARVGGAYSGGIPADGQWHPIIKNLTGCHTFEIVAKADGGKHRGKYAMAHAIAISVFGKPSSKIRVTQSWSSSFWDRIMFRWRGNVDNYWLEMKTRRHYGVIKSEGAKLDKPYYVLFHACSLWDDKIFTKK